MGRLDFLNTTSGKEVTYLLSATSFEISLLRVLFCSIIIKKKSFNSSWNLRILSEYRVFWQQQEGFCSICRSAPAEQILCPGSVEDKHGVWEQSQLRLHLVSAEIGKASSGGQPPSAGYGYIYLLMWPVTLRGWLFARNQDPESHRDWHSLPGLQIFTPATLPPRHQL